MSRNNFDLMAPKDAFNSPVVLEKLKSVVNGRETQFVTSLLSIVNNNSHLAKASNTSVLNAAMKAATLDLPIDPNLGFAYIVPYGSEAQFQLGYKGLIQLAQRSGQIVKLNAGEIYASQFKGYNPLTEDLEVDMQALPKANEEVAGYFAFMRLSNGFEKTLFWTKDRVLVHGKKYSRSFSGKSSPWQTDFDAMARKTVLKQLLSTYAPLSIEMQQAIIDDNVDSNIQNNGAKDVTPPEATESLESFLEGGPADNTTDRSRKTNDKTTLPEKERTEQAGASDNTPEVEDGVYEELGLFEGGTITPKEQK